MSNSHGGNSYLTGDILSDGMQGLVAWTWPQAGPAPTVRLAQKVRCNECPSTYFFNERLKTWVIPAGVSARKVEKKAEKKRKEGGLS